MYQGLTHSGNADASAESITFSGCAHPRTSMQNENALNLSLISRPIGLGDFMLHSISVGLSRKASKDYQSTGCSINVTLELDQALLAKPEELQKQIADLYGHAESALARQVLAIGDSPSPQHSHERDTRRRITGNGR